MSSPLSHFRFSGPSALHSVRRPPPLIARASARHASSKIRQPRAVALEHVTPIDPRPWWGFPLSRIANYVVIPATLLYAVFFADFGEREHVFMPARRWLDTQKAAFFDLSEAEREIAGVAPASDSNSVDGAEDRRDQ